MTPSELLAFIRAQKWAVQSSVSESGAPQAAVIGVAVTNELELVFDTLESTRKCENLRRDPRIALVIGWDDAQTVQLEGVADEPTGAQRERLVSVYLENFRMEKNAGAGRASRTSACDRAGSGTATFVATSRRASSLRARSFVR